MPLHESVLVNEVLEYLAPRDHETYCDCTVGFGGHAGKILEAAPNCRLIGIDRDSSALEHTRQRLVGIELIHGEFGNIAQLLPAPVDGLLVDLGVSSPQFDRAERGFSFTHDGPLDMRMDQSQGPTARELIKSLDADALGELIRDFGEERYGMKIARAIKDAAREDRLHTTHDLAKICERAIPTIEQRKSKIHPATRTFQALRIAVNGELDQLERFLAAFPDLLKPGGRCVAISFHSLEDRLVKNRFRDLAWTSSLPRAYADKAGERVEPVCEQLTGKPVFATEAEVERNPRARSARLRACVRTDAPNLPAIAGSR